ncbi:GNAT family N-acetyltransferase [Candidatus Leptofilum sp.]|uniref:GNAT family N-acetyltransferase n=1 Tax=Candidatus Leptofilum sp. TaxID=3241576 RepID=UPI003B594FD1
MEILLETVRLRLRRFAVADVNHLFALDNDPEVMRYLNGGVSTPRHVVAQEILPGFMQIDPTRPAFGFWAAEMKESGEFVGWFSIRPLPENPRHAALGYRLVRAGWGQGLATEGVRALIHKAFAELGVARVVATTYEHNIASRHVMEKAGMRLVRRFRLTPEALQATDTFHTEAMELWDGDDVEYALDKLDWEKQHNDGR